MSKPYLSIVVTSRNDNHGGNMTDRMRLFVNGLLKQTKKYQLEAELVFVEWNPPPDRPLLKEVLPVPEKGDYLTIRYIVVPNKIHQRYKRGLRLPLFQMIAKNVGIRRAKGDFVLCTNVDVLFSDELMVSFAKKNLKKNHFYRANRKDVPNTIPLDWSIEEQLDFCKKNVTVLLGKDARFLYLGHVPPFIYRSSVLTRVANPLAKRYKAYKKPKAVFMLESLDTDACGDFTLMAKEDWIKMQGYAELDLYSIHIDSLGIYAARAAGIEQIVFPTEACIYHLEHRDGWGAMSPLEKIKFFERMPSLGYDVVYDIARQAFENDTRIELNPDDWGFRDHDFTEYCLTPNTSN